MTNSKDMLRNNVVVITGGAGLLGRAFARSIANAGGVSVIADINAEAGRKAAEEIAEGTGTTVDFVQLDITSRESALAMIDRIVSRHGKIDGLVNNAYPRNRNYGRKLEEVSYADFCENVGTHLGGYFLMSQQLGAYFKKQRSGNIINMSSIYGVMAPRFEVYDETSMTMPVEYAAIKSSVIHLTRYFAKYYKGHNIRVNAISPGGILDNQPGPFLDRYASHCLSKGMLVADDLLGTLIYLLSDASQFVNGQNIIVDDGFSL